MHELRRGAVVEHLGALVRQQTSCHAIGGRVGQREADALELHDRLAELLAFGGPGDGLVEQALHGADAAGGDVDALLDEPGVLPLAAAADLAGPAEYRALRDDAVEAVGRVPVREDVGEQRVVNDLDAGARQVDQKQRGQQVASVEDVGHHDQEVRMVAARDEPLLTADAKAALDALRDCLDARGIGAGVTLGDGVGIGTFAGQGRAQVRLDLLGRAERQHVVAAAHQPPEAVRNASELLVDDDVLHHLPALSAVLGGMVTSDQLELTGQPTDLRLYVVGHAAAGLLGRYLVRDQGVGKAAGPRAQILLLRGEGEVHGAPISRR